MTPNQVADFITSYQSVFFSDEGRKKLISMRVPEKLLSSFKTKAKLSNQRYQNKIVDLMREWLLNGDARGQNAPTMIPIVRKVISGGQTGMDRAALDVALRLRFSIGGWCPQGRLAEDGPIGTQYQLEETPSEDPKIRTEWNVRDSDGTLVILWKPMPSDGTAFTIECAGKWKKNLMIIDLTEDPEPKAENVRAWIERHKIETLNIAGPRQSYRDDVYLEAYRLIHRILSKT